MAIWKSFSCRTYQRFQFPIKICRLLLNHHIGGLSVDKKAVISCSETYPQSCLVLIRIVTDINQSASLCQSETRKQKPHGRHTAAALIVVSCCCLCYWIIWFKIAYKMTKAARTTVRFGLHKIFKSDRTPPHSKLGPKAFFFFLFDTYVYRKMYTTNGEEGAGLYNSRPSSKGGGRIRRRPRRYWWWCMI